MVAKLLPRSFSASSTIANTSCPTPLPLPLQDVVVELAKVNHQPVVYLTQAVRVHLTGQAQAAYTAFQQGCKGLWESDTAPRVMSRQ
jgi:hypothetical protein